MPDATQSLGAAPIDTPEPTFRFAYSPAEAAQLLGVTPKHLYALMARGELRSTKIGRARRIPRSEVLRLADEVGGER